MAWLVFSPILFFADPIVAEFGTSGSPSFAYAGESKFAIGCSGVIYMLSGITIVVLYAIAAVKMIRKSNVRSNTRI